MRKERRILGQSINIATINITVKTASAKLPINAWIDLGPGPRGKYIHSSLEHQSQAPVNHSHKQEYMR